MTEPTATNLKTGQPLKITLSKGAGRKHGEAAGVGDWSGIGGTPESSPIDQREAGRRRTKATAVGPQRQGKAEVTVPAPMQLARQLAPRSPKRQAGILLGYLIADAVAAALRGRT